MLVRCLALLSLLSLACADAGTRYVEAPGQDDADLRAAAHVSWETVGVEAPADYTLLFLDPAALVDACNVQVTVSGYVGGCSFPGVVLLNSEDDFDHHLLDLTHELGHMMRPHKHADQLDLSHLSCPESDAEHTPGTDVMCAHGAPVGTLPTLRDAAFVTR